MNHGPTQWGRVVLAAVLLAATIVVGVSPLHRERAPAAWASVALGALLAVLAEGARVQGKRGLAARLSLLDLALLSQIALATAQALVSTSLPSPHASIDDVPGIDVFYLLLAGTVACLATWMALWRGDVGRVWAALACAGLFSSTLYQSSFAVPESGPMYVPVFAFLLAALALLWPRLRGAHLGVGMGLKNAAGARGFELWSLTFLVAYGASALVSPTLGPGLNAWLRMACTIVLSLVLARSIWAYKEWSISGWCVVVLGGALPVVLGIVKWLSLVSPFGFGAALAYRFAPNELGGANLTARSVLSVLPLAVSLTKSASGRVSRWVGRVMVGGGLCLILYARSLEGLFAVSVALLVYGFLEHWQRVKGVWQGWAGAHIKRWLSVAGGLALVGVLLVVLWRAAPTLNVFSFNDRLLHWAGAGWAWMEHPWLGGGPGNETIYTPYGEHVGLVVSTQVTRDHPLSVIHVNAGRPLMRHAHNLFLEIGARTGTPGFVSFVGLIAAIVWLGLWAWRKTGKWMRSWVAGSLAGLAGMLAWGMLDVLAITPPFFSFPGWALVGLLIAAAGGYWELGGQDQVVDGGDPLVVDAHSKTAMVHRLFLVVLSLIVVLAPSCGYFYYARGFLALQEQRLGDAVESLELAVRFRPLDPRSHQLLGQAHLGQWSAGQGDDARARAFSTSAYERAGALDEGYSPYSSQLGWLAWLRGDVTWATTYFKRAVAADPGEAWREGLHADLGLAYAAQGQYGQATAAFKEAIELHPQSAGLPYWRKVRLPDGRFEVVLDPVYLGRATPELEKRILAQLGAANSTERQFSYGDLTQSTLLLNEVLDAVESDYDAACSIQSERAPLLLAALAEGARAAGLYGRAERAFLEFQLRYPDSAYGFRELGTLYREQGRLTEAVAMLERAVEVSPRDTDSRLYLVDVYVDQKSWGNAERTLDWMMAQSLVTQFHSRLFDAQLHAAWARLYLARGELEQAIQAQRRVVLIRGEPADYLGLADLYRRAVEPKQAQEQCIRAAEALLRTWPRPLAPELWEAGTCLAQMPGEDGFAHAAQLARRYPATGNVLLGHAYRASGQLEQALSAYQRASEARPDEGAAYYFQGETWLGLERPELAEEAYRRAAQLDPWESLSLVALGEMLWSLGQEDAALESLDAAVRVTPGWGQAHVALGNVLLMRGEKGEAAQHYQLAQIADDSASEGVFDDLAVRLAEAEIDSPAPQYVRRDVFSIEGTRRPVVFQHPDSRVSYVVDVVEGMVFSFDVALHPESWRQPGDGVTFAVYVRSDAGAQQIFESYIDPKHRDADRRWHAYAVDLGVFADQTVDLILETTSGPAGDDRFDWAGWGRPRLLVRRE